MTYVLTRYRFGEFTASQIPEAVDDLSTKASMTDEERETLIKALFHEALGLDEMKARELIDLYRRYGVAYRMEKSQVNGWILKTIEDAIVYRMEE